MALKNYVIKRIIYSGIILFAVININYVIFRLAPDDPVSLIVGGNTAFLRDPNVKAAFYHQLGLDQPWYVQYAIYVKGLLTLDFGNSYASFQTKPIWQDLSYRIPNTILLLGSSLLVAVIIGVALGVLAASRRGWSVDIVSQAGSLFSYALPVFWLGLIFQFLFFYWLHWFPQTYISSVSLADMPSWMQQLPPILQTIADRLWHLILPMTALVIISFGGWALLVRNTLTDIFTEDYIVTARAKGLNERTVLYKHALRNAMLPLVTSLGLSIGFLLSGATLTETVFTWQGMGRWSFEAIQHNDYPVLQAFFYLVSLTVIVSNLIADVLYAFLDPRVRY